MKNIYSGTLLLLICLSAFSQVYLNKNSNPWQWVEAPGIPNQKPNQEQKLPCLPPNPTSLTCGSTVTFSLTASGYNGGDPTTAAGSCGQCCFGGSDLDCDGQQDVSFSVENSKWYKYCNNTGATQTISMTADEPGTGGDCNIQGAIWVGANLDATTLNCNNSGFGEFGSNPGGGADGFTFSNITIPNGQCAFIMVDGYAGAQCSGIGITANCPTCTAPTSANAGTDVTICEGSSVTLTGSHSGGTGTIWRKWSTGSTTINSGSPGSTTASVSPTTTTTYTYTVCMDGVGTTCCVSDQVTVTVTPTFTPNAGANVTICPGGSSTLGGSPTGPAGSTYSWACSPCDADITLSSSTVANPTVNIAGGGAGTATYTVTVTNGACIKTDVVVVTIGAVVANAGADNSVCPGSSIAIGGSPTGPAGSTYSWSCTSNCDPDVTLSSATTANPTLSVAGTQTAAISPVYTVTVTLGSCAPVTDAVTITVNAKPATPAATASASPICAGASVTLTGPGAAGVTYSWWSASSGGTNLGAGNTLNVTPLATTTYFLQSTDNTTGCVSDRGSVTVTVNPTPVATAGADAEKCQGSTFTLAGSCANCGSCSPNQTWSIISGSGTFSPDVNTANATFAASSSGTISLVLSPCNPGGCTPVTDTVVLTVNPLPTVTATIDDDTMCENLITILDASGAGGTPFPASNVATTFNSSSSASITDGSAGGFPGNCGTAATIPIAVSGITSTNIGGSVTVTICLNISHPKTSDIDQIILCAPGGSPCITLVANGTLANGVNMTSTCFSDASATDISLGTAPYSGTFNPQGSVAMTDLNGASTNGTWTLSVQDCKNNNVGTFDSWSISISEPVVTNPYTYSWTSASGISDPDSSTTYYSSFGVSGPTTITKTVTVTDYKGCTGTTTVSTYIDASAAAVSGGGAICSGDSASVNIALTGVGPWDLTYAIDGVPQTPVTGITSSPYTIQSTAAGVYTVSAVSDNYCNGTSSGNATVTVSSAPTPSITASGVLTFCQGGNVVLDAGTFTSYLWSTGAATQTINVTASGPYTVTVTNAGGCTGTDSKTVTVNPNPTATAANNGPICSGNTLSLTGGAGGMTSYLWSGPGSFSSSLQSPVVSSSATTAMSGTYTITITDGNGCTNTITTTVTVNSLPSATASNNGPICTGNPLSLTGGASGMTSYSWGGPNSFSSSSQSPAVSASATTVMAGTYTITITDGNGCTNINTTVVTVNSLPSATASNSGPICAGNPLSLTGGASGMTSYSWSGPNTFSSSSQSPVVSVSATTAMSGTYTITIIDGNGCTGTTTTIATVNSNPVAVITPSPSLSFCPGENITLTSDPASIYLWSTGANTLSISVSTGGTFSVTVTNGSGCTDTESVVTSVSSAMTLSTASQNSNCGAFDGKVSVSATGSGPFTYLWNTSPAQTTDTAIGLPAGNYTVTVTDINGCKATATAGISDIGGPTPTLTITGATSFCDGDSVTLTSSIADSWLWSSGDTTQSIVVKTSGTYSVAVVVGGCSGTSEDTTITVFANPAPVISSSGPISFCQGGSVLLNAGGGFTSYSWSTLETTQNINVNTTGTFVVTVTNSNGCTGTATKSVNVNPIPTPVITPDGPISFCQGDTVLLTATAAAAYLWSTAATSQAMNATSTGTYSVTVTNDSSCTGNTSISINVNSNPTATITAGGATTFCQGDSVTLNAGIHTTYSWSTSETAQNIVANSSGTYSVTVTNDSACTATANVTIVVNSNPALSITPSGPVSFCSGGNADLDAGTGFTNYSWSTGVTTQLINVSSSGTYVVTVTNSSNCTATDSVAVIENSSLTPSIAASGPTSFCQGGSVGLDAGSGYTSYNWSTIETTQTITVSASGIYTVTVTDANGCTGTDNISVTVNSNPTATISGSPLSFCQGDSSLLTATAASTYLWNTGETTQSIYVNASGDFVVTITDSNGCTDVSDTTSIAVNPAPSATILAGGPTTFCQGGSVTLSSSAASGNLWSNGLTTQNVNVTSSGNYSVTVTDGNGCSAISTPIVVTVNSNPAPSITPSASPTFCNGDSISLTCSAGSSYSWSTGETTQSIVVNSSGSYVVTMTDANGCSGSTPSITISVLPNPTPVIDTSSSSICSGISITLDAGTGYTDYLWSTSEITQIITIAATGSYDVTVTDGNGCIGVAAPFSVTLNQPAPLILAMAMNSSTCGNANGDATASVSGGTASYSYLWNTTPAQTDSTATGLSAGSYFVTVTDSLGCAQTANVSVSDIGGPSVTIANVDSVNCFGGSDGQATVAPSSGTSPYIYQWSNSQTDSTATGLPGGTYSVTITDANGCTNTASVTVNEPTLLSGSLTKTDATCGSNNGTVSANATGGTSPYNYSWSTTPPQNSDTATGLSAGTYSVTITDNNGCTASGSATVSGSDGATVTTTATNVLCNGDSSGNAVANATGGVTPYSYLWSDGQSDSAATGLSAGTYYITVTDSNNCTTVDSAMVSQPAAILTATISQTNVSCNGGSNGSATATATGGTTNYSYLWSGGQTTPTVSGLDTGTYTVTVTDANICTITQTVIINEPAALVAVALPNTPCGADSGSVAATVTGGTTPFSYLWSNGSGTQNIAALPPGNYIVTVTDNNGCTDTASATVSIAPVPTIIKSKDTTVFQDTEVTLFASGGVSYAWSTVPSETAPSFSIIPEETTTYYVTVTNAAGCSKVDSVKITVENKYVIFVPSMFSPNVDGNNDAVYARGKGISSINFAIYDRWGEKVFETSDITVGWDGKYRGKEMNSAVFVYVLNAVMDDGNTVERKGNITLVR